MTAEVRLNEYELLYIVHPRRAADEVSTVIDWVNGLVEQGGGEVLTVDNWGSRRLAYPIDHEFEGTYVLTTLRLSSEAPRAIESQMVISEDIMRHILIRGIMALDREEESMMSVQAENQEDRAPVGALAGSAEGSSLESSTDRSDLELKDSSTEDETIEDRTDVDSEAAQANAQAD